MTWTKLSDDFADDCARVRLSDAAFRAHVEGLLWCMRRENGGRLDAVDVRRGIEVHDADAAIAELVAVGFWQRTDAGYRLVHAMEHQPEPDVIQARRDAEAERQRRARRKRTGLPVDDESMSRRDARRDTPRDPGRDGTGRDQDRLRTADHNETDVRVREAGPGLVLTPYLRKWAASRGWPDDGSLDQTLIEWGPLSEAEWCHRLRETTERAAYEREAG